MGSGKQTGGHATDEILEVIGDRGAEEGHGARLVGIEVIVATGDDVAEVVAVETGDDPVGPERFEVVFDGESELAAEIARG